MASEAGSGENNATPDSHGALDLAWRLQESESQGTPGTVGCVGTLQAAAGGRAAEESIFSVMDLEPGMALETGQEAVVVLEDIMEVVVLLTEEEVVAQEEQEEGQDLLLVVEDIMQVAEVLTVQEVVTQEEQEGQVLLLFVEDMQVVELLNIEEVVTQEEEVEGQEVEGEMEEMEVTEVEWEADEEVQVTGQEEEAQAAEREEEVQAEAWEEKPVELQQSQPWWTRARAQSPLDALEALQLEMEPVNKQAGRAQCRLKLKIRQRQKPYLELRSTIIQGIHGFWAKVFANHPEMSAMIRNEDENMLSYMVDLQVEEVRRRRDCCKITLFFQSNPYFCNNVIVKEYVLHVTGYRASRATPIQWYQHYEREAYSRSHHDSRPNFFNWLAHHNFAGSGRIAEIIIKDLWPNPLHYYMRSMAADEGMESAAGVETEAGY